MEYCGRSTIGSSSRPSIAKLAGNVNSKTTVITTNEMVSKNGDNDTIKKIIYDYMEHLFHIEILLCNKQIIIKIL